MSLYCYWRPGQIWKMGFVFSGVAIFHPAKRWSRERESSYSEHFRLYVFPQMFSITFPQDVDIFERKNCVSVNVFSYNREKKFVQPLKVVDELEKRIDLLLVDNHVMNNTNFAALSSNFRSARVRCKHSVTGFQWQESLKKKQKNQAKVSSHARVMSCTSEART